uniref:Uncharacterized protein n=1 Tax=Anguilla anguilla TaxID=7936 RepID=A0A0E9WBW5_ANGAN
MCMVLNISKYRCGSVCLMGACFSFFTNTHKGF